MRFATQSQLRLKEKKEMYRLLCTRYKKLLIGKDKGDNILTPFPVYNCMMKLKFSLLKLIMKIKRLSNAKKTLLYYNIRKSGYHNETI